MTNWERWSEYTDGLASPQNYVDWGFIYLICASLQRRVWSPPSHSKLYPNIYITLVGKPGIGKGMLIRRVSEILKYHKIADMKFNQAKNEDEQKMLDMLAETQTKEAKDNSRGDLIPMLPDAITYEKLVYTMANAISRINYHELDIKTGKERMRVATHCSLAACVEELASLFRRNTDSLVNFLIQAYDCTNEYKNDTIGRGEDRILNVCLNFMGGTNPDFIKQIFDEKLVSGGFASRQFFIWANKNRKSACFIPELTQSQQDHRTHLINHVHKLTLLYGQCIIEENTLNWMNEWWSDFEKNPYKRACRSPKMDGYYSRLNIHAMKIGMAFHFMESTDMCVPLSCFQRAIIWLEKEAKTMHLALTLDGDTPESKFSAKIKSYLSSNGKQTFVLLLKEFWPAGVRKDMLTEILQALQDIGEIETKTEDDGAGSKQMWYSIKL